MPRVNLGQSRRQQLEAQRKERAQLGELIRSTAYAQQRSLSSVAKAAGFSGNTMYRRLEDPETLTLGELKRIFEQLGVDPALREGVVRPWI